MIKLRYKNGSSTAVTEEFRELFLVELPEVDRLQPLTLRGRLCDHRRYTRRTWQLTITTEAEVNDVLWLSAWWTADTRWIQQPYAATDINWIEVTTEGGKVPMTFVEGVLDLPEVTLTISAKDPS
jgi:hypothetical protein